MRAADVSRRRAPVIRVAVLTAAMVGATAMASSPEIGWTAAASSDSAAAQHPAAVKAAPCRASGGHWWCNNHPGAAVGVGKKVVGHLKTGRNWFSYRCESFRNNSGPHPNRFAYTKADNGRWGYVSDGDITSETNSLPNHGRCR
ncbi:MAG: hypothetical protein ACRD0P_21825 [Stackebrandtia sp.]